MRSPSYSKAYLSHQALTSSGQYKTIIMAESQSISPLAKPPIYLCFQIIRQLWLAVNGQWHFSHFTPPLSLFFPSLSLFCPSLTLQEEPQNCVWIMGIKQPSQAETHQEIDTTAEMMPTHSVWTLWNMTGKIQNHLWLSANILKHLVRLVCRPASSPLRMILLFFCAKDVWFVLRHRANNQQDLRVGLGFLHAVILRILLRHMASSPLCPNDAFVDVAVTWDPVLLVSREERKKSYSQMDACAVS